jgi:hypothetical protein
MLYISVKELQHVSSSLAFPHDLQPAFPRFGFFALRDAVKAFCQRAANKRDFSDVIHPTPKCPGVRV